MRFLDKELDCTIGYETFAALRAANPSKAGFFFEYAMCRHYGLLNWNEITPDQFNDVLCLPTAQPKGVRDVGVDGVRIEGDVVTETYQFKYKQSITCNEISRYVGISSMLADVPPALHWVTNVGANYTKQDKPIIDKMLSRMTWQEILVAHVEKLFSQACAERERRLVEKDAVSAERLELRDYQIEAVDMMWQRYQMCGQTDISVVDETDDDSVVDETDDDTQSEAATDIEFDFRADCKINMVCGLGKTLVASEFVSRLQLQSGEECVVVTCPTLILQDQWRDSLVTYGLSYAICNGDNPIDDVSDQTQVYICTFHPRTLQNALEHLDACGVDVKAIIVDESHHVLDQNSVALRKILEGTDCYKCYLSGTTGVKCDFVRDLEFGIANDYLIDYNIVLPTLIGDKKHALALLVKEYHYNRVLAYCNSVKEAREFTKILKSYDVAAATYDASHSIAHRRRVNADFACGKIQVVTTVNVLGEGVNIPSADTCLFVEPRNSAFNVMQCIGRVLRKSEGKNIAHVIMPDMDNRYLSRFVQKLGEYDSRISREYLNGKSARIKVLVGTDKPTGDEDDDDIDEDDDNAAGVVSVDVYNRLGAIIGGPWLQKYEELRDYLAAGNPMPVRRNKQFGTWINNQRTNHKKGKLAQERIAKLKALPGWYWGYGHDAIWNKQYEELRDYLAAGTPMPPQSNKQFGAWIDKQRQNHKKGKLAQDRVQKLKALPGWCWDPQDTIWNEKYEELRDYLAAGNPIPLCSNKQFGTWINKQRTNHKKGILAQDRVQKLKALPGWYWDQFDDAWNEKYEELRDYLAAGNPMPLRSNKQFGTWINTQRTNHKKGKLAQDRVQKLKALPGWCWGYGHDAVWNEQYEELRDYLAAGNPIPLCSNKQFGAWINTQRQYYKKGKLAQERITKLKALPGWWWSKK